MYEYPGDYLMTYDTDFIEQHVDSSDFEDNCIPLVSPKNANHNLVRNKPRNKTRKNTLKHKEDPDLYIDCDEYPVKLKNVSKKCTIDMKTHDKRNQKSEPKCKKLNNLNQGDQVQPVRSKLSMMRHKIIPCISSIFKRNNNSSKHLSIIQENRDENTRADNCCQHCTDRRRTRKSYNTQNYAVQPVYAIEGNIHETTATFVSTKITGEPLKDHNRKKSKNPYPNCCSLSSSSESEPQHILERQQKVKKFRQRLKMEILKEHLKYRQNRDFRTQELQYPSISSQKPQYQIFTTPFQSRTNVTPGLNCQNLSEIPKSTSSFWDYLFDKASKKYQTQRVELPKPCQCTSSQQFRCCTGSNQYTQEIPPNSTCRSRQRNLGTNCCCNQKAAKRSPVTTPKEPTGAGQSMSCPENCSLRSITPKTSPMTVNKKPIETNTNKVQCKCFAKLKKPPRSFDSKPPKTQIQGQEAWDTPASLTPTGIDQKPCQENHDDIARSLAQKYNGEVLCIHNPPCILINGCLNLPPQKEQPQTSLWPVTDSNKPNLYGTKKKVIHEQSCQYQIPNEVQQNQTVDSKSEKKIQSICSHKPPCEVVRGCHIPDYDPYIQNSCVHVPMCKKIPECVAMKRTEGKLCEHRPRCPEVPICSKNFIILTATENVGTQVKPEVKENYICRHVPPCIMIPKCLGKAMCEAYMPLDSIPDCIHRPSCDMIPACCRKMTKQMVSVSCQYPNSCRIV